MELNKEEKMEYSKPMIVAENNASGCYAAACAPITGCASGSLDRGTNCQRCDTAR